VAALHEETVQLAADDFDGADVVFGEVFAVHDAVAEVADFMDFDLEVNLVVVLNCSCKRTGSNRPVLYRQRVLVADNLT
jgi:hypothetical protein